MTPLEGVREQDYSVRMKKLATLAVVSVVLVTFSGPLGAQSGRALTIEDYYKIKSVGDTQISPDGKWLALTLTDGGVTNIWALPTTGGPMRQITDFGQRRTFIARRVCWSSDGKFIFASLGEGNADVVLLEGLTP